MSADPLAQPFDHYQRFRPVADLIDDLRDRRGIERLTVLDLGGAEGHLRAFLPRDRVVVVDPGPLAIPDLVGRGEALPFSNASFHAAVCVDTLEHVRAPIRESLVGELSRVASDLVLLAAPFKSPEVEAAEDFVEACHRAIYGRCDGWLLEHESLGLPSLPQAVQALSRAFHTVRVIPNGYLPYWRFTMAVNYLLLSVPESHDIYSRLNREVNSRYYRLSHRDPSYRKLVVATRDGGEWIDRAITDLTAEAASAREGLDGLESDALGILGEGLSGSVASKLDLVHQLEGHVHQLEGHTEHLQDELRGAETYAHQVEEEYRALQREYDHAKGHVKELERYIREMEAEFAKVDRVVNEWGVEKELLRQQNEELERRVRRLQEEIDLKERELPRAPGATGGSVLSLLRRLRGPVA